MKTDLRIVMMCHLSDAQHLIELGCTREANKEINFVKLLMLKFDNEVEVSKKEINELWKTL